MRVKNMKVDFSNSDLTPRTGCVDAPGTQYDGLQTDGLSGPFIVRLLYGRFDFRTIGRVIPHDFEYATHTKDGTTPITRKESDHDLFDGIKNDPNTQAWIMRSKRLRWWRRLTWNARANTGYVLIRLFGWFAWWRSHRKFLKANQ